MSWSFSLKPTSIWKEDSADPEERSEIKKSLELSEIEESNIIPISKQDADDNLLRILIQEPSADVSESEIEKECYDWMEHSQEIQNEGQLVNGKIKIVENMLCRAAIIINGKKIKKGSWICALRINDDELLEDFERGEFKISGRSLQEI